MSKAIIYARQSSGSDDFSESVEQQIFNCKTIADKEGVEIVGVFSDLNTSGKTYPEGAEDVAKLDMAFQGWFKEQTGSKMFRAGLGNVLKQASNIDFIIVDDLTRLYRPLAKSFLEGYVNQILELNKVKILTVKSGMIDVSKFNDSLISTLQARINDNQIAIQRKKSMDGLKKLKNSGIICNGAKMYGIKYLGNRKIEVNQDEATVIKYVFEQIASYAPYTKIIQEVNTQFKSVLKNTFWQSSLYHIASQPIYAGYQYNSDGQLIKNIQITGQEIISFELWQTVQKIMENKRREPSKAKFRWLPFSGLLYCGCCGGKLVTGIDRYGQNVFYHCQKATFEKNEGCKKSRIRMNIDTAELFGLYEAVFPLLSIALIERYKKVVRKQEAKKHIEEMQLKLANMQKKEKAMFDLFSQDLLTEDQLADMLKDHKQKRIELQMDIAAAGEAVTDDEKALIEKRLSEEFSKLTNMETENGIYEELLKEVFKKITVHETFVEFCTIYGTFKIERVRVKNKNYLPKWGIGVDRKHWGSFNFADEGLTLEIDYRYASSFDGDKEKNLIADLGQIKIFSIGKN